jgi:hypothetical protein
MTDLNPATLASVSDATLEIIAAANRLQSLVARVCSCAPDPSATQLDEHDVEAITLALAETMAMCAAYLEDAGFDTSDVSELSEQIVGDLSVARVLRQDLPLAPPFDLSSSPSGQ